MTEMAILFDSSRCTGCRGCQVACKCWNDLPSEPTVNWDGKFTHPADLNSCTRLIMTFEDFEDEKSQKRVGWAFGRRACQHCTNAGCVNMCPAGALYKDEETGMVTYDQDKCIGCQNCSAACPYDVPRYEDRGGKTVINKCSGCVDRIAQGMMPACVTTCQPGALQFGTRKYPDKRMHPFNDISFDYILDQATKKLPGYMLCHERLLFLQEHDDSSGSDYMRTLRCYLDNHCNVVQTARELFIHRSTLLYRLEKIKEILESDLSSPDEILYLMLSFRFIDLENEEENRSGSSQPEKHR